MESHKGRWSILSIARDIDYGDELGVLLHISDYIASRSHVLVFVGLEVQNMIGAAANANS